MTTIQTPSYVTKYAITYFGVIEYDDIEDTKQMSTIELDYNNMFEIIDIDDDDSSISNTYEYSYFS